jgi:hypothetical protein
MYSIFNISIVCIYVLAAFQYVLANTRCEIIGLCKPCERFEMVHNSLFSSNLCHNGYYECSGYYIIGIRLLSKHWNEGAATMYSEGYGS